MKRFAVIGHANKEGVNWVVRHANPDSLLTILEGREHYVNILANLPCPAHSILTPILSLAVVATLIRKPASARAQGVELRGAGAQAVELQGAGATVPAPLYQKWFRDFTAQHPETKFDYESLGSAGGIRRISSNKVDFGAYPICALTYFLVYKQQSDQAKGKALVDFLWWALHDGQRSAPPMNYGPLPPQIARLAEQQIKSITY